MNYPEYVKVNDKKYKINTNFKIAIKCNEIAQDKNISNIEKSLAIIYLLFGDEGIDNPQDYEKLMELGQKFLLCGKPFEDSNEKPNMDFSQDYGLIWASMYSDYSGLDIDKEDIHWWKFMDLMNGLSNSELGNCCILNNVRNIRDYDISKIKDDKEREKAQKAQEYWALEKYKDENNLTPEQEESMKAFNKILGIE